jgi:CRP/FNR family transcriptional regulator, cyclic AMP receptor protein
MSALLRWRRPDRHTWSVTGWRLLELLDEQQRTAFTQRARRRRFKRNEVVFHDGDPGETLHLVVKGHFAVRITTPLGQTAALRILGPGDHFGELSVLAPAARTGTVVALDTAETLSLHREALDELRRDVPEVQRVLTEALIAEVRRLAAALVDALYVPVEQRVWRRLRELADVYRENGAPVVVPLTQDDLAQLAGTTRSSANRVLRAAHDAGAIRLARGRIEVLDLKELDRLAR